MLKPQKKLSESQKGNEGRRGGEGKLSNSPARRQGMASRLQVWPVPHRGCHGAVRRRHEPRETKVWGGAGEAP